MNQQNSLKNDIFMKPSKVEVKGEFKATETMPNAANCSGHCQSGTCIPA